MTDYRPWRLLLPSGRVVTVPITLVGTYRIYFSTPGHSDRIIEIRVSKPEKGKRKNRPTLKVMDDSTTPRDT